MPELPKISGDEIIKVFLAFGFVVTRQKGSHVVLRRGDKGCVPPVSAAIGGGSGV